MRESKIESECESGEQGVDDSVDIEFAKVGVFLSDPYIDDGTACGVDHAKSSSDWMLRAAYLCRLRYRIW